GHEHQVVHVEVRIRLLFDGPLDLPGPVNGAGRRVEDRQVDRLLRGRAARDPLALRVERDVGAIAGDVPHLLSRLNLPRRKAGIGRGSVKGAAVRTEGDLLDRVAARAIWLRDEG